MGDDRLAASGGFVGWLRHLLTRLIPADGTIAAGRALKPVRRQRRVPDEQEWVLLESVGSAALGGLYQSLLRSAGVPVLTREWGGGSAVLGGVPVGVSLFVPRARLAEARAILTPEGTREGD